MINASSGSSVVGQVWPGKALGTSLYWVVRCQKVDLTPFIRLDLDSGLPYHHNELE